MGSERFARPCNTLPRVVLKIEFVEGSSSAMFDPAGKHAHEVHPPRTPQQAHISQPFLNDGRPKGKNAGFAVHFAWADI